MRQRLAGAARGLAADRGVWAIALLAAAVVPAWIHTAAFHRAHWFGPAPDHAFWPSFVVPWAARGQVALVLVALAGWAATPEPARRGLAGPRTWGGALRGIGAALVASVAAVPGWIWLVRLGAVSPAGAGALFLTTWISLAVGAGLSGAIGAWVPGAPAALGGVVGGLWVFWLAEAG